MNNPDWARRFRPMLRARRFDEALCQNGDLVNDTYHVSIGLEASAAALALVRTDGDTVMLTHRNHGQLAAMGSDLAAMYREIFGRDGLPLRARGGSFHLIDPQRGVPYTSAMVAGGVPLAVGAGLAKARLGGGSIAFACFGDGAMEEGLLYESLNIARHWDVPVVFICDNNESGPQRGRTKFVSLAEVCGVVASSIESLHPSDVETEIAIAATAVRDGKGPRFVEVLCRAWPGNATGAHPRDVTGPFDVEEARSATDGWSRLDPLGQEVRDLIEEGGEMVELLEVDHEIRAEVGAALAAALSAPLAPPSVVGDDVWAAS